MLSHAVLLLPLSCSSSACGYLRCCVAHLLCSATVAADDDDACRVMSAALLFRHYAGVCSAAASAS
jgi:hypothetical protein